LHPSFVSPFFHYVPLAKFVLQLGDGPRIQSLSARVEPTSGADQSFTFLSTPAVPKINTGTPPKENNSSVIIRHHKTHASSEEWYNNIAFCPKQVGVR
jgi:hypothetical protein